MSFLREGDIDHVLQPGEMALVPGWVVRGYPKELYPEVEDLFIDAVWPACGHMMELAVSSSPDNTRSRWKTRTLLKEEIKNKEEAFSIFVNTHLPKDHKRIRWTRPEVTMAGEGSILTFTQIGWAAYTDTLVAHNGIKRPFVLEDKKAQLEPNIGAMVERAARSWSLKNIWRLLRKDFL